MSDPSDAGLTLERWCGAAFELPILNRTLSPCYFETAAAALFLLLLLATLLLRSAQLGLVSATLRLASSSASSQHGGDAGDSSKKRRPRGTTATEGLLVAASLFLFAMHAMHLALALAVPSIR